MMSPVSIAFFGSSLHALFVSEHDVRQPCEHGCRPSARRPPWVRCEATRVLQATAETGGGVAEAVERWLADNR